MKCINHKFNRLATFLVILTILIFSCSKPIERVKDRTWEGQIYRSKDDKKLSDLRLKISNDTLFIFANAIFGIGNDTLTVVSDNLKDSTVIYKNKVGDKISLNYKYKKTDKAETLNVTGNDFYITLIISSLDIKEPKALDFFKYINVPRDPIMYLEGAYEGDLEMENQVGNLYLASIGGIKLKYVFIDDFKVKIFVKSLAMDMFSNTGKPNYEIVGYKVIGKKLILDKNKQKANIIEVKNNGETLVLATDQANAILHKIY